MNKNDLRIGNIVYKSYTNGGNKKEYSIKPHDFVDFESVLFLYDPIPLTEEWLQKFGFIENPDLDECEYYIIIYEYDTENSNITTYLCFKFNNEGVLKKSMIQMMSERHEENELLSEFIENELQIKHVHTLQNFIFALTGNELQIK